MGIKKPFLYYFYMHSDCRIFFCSTRMAERLVCDKELTLSDVNICRGFIQIGSDYFEIGNKAVGAVFIGHNVSDIDNFEARYLNEGKSAVLGWATQNTLITTYTSEFVSYVFRNIHDKIGRPVSTLVDAVYADAVYADAFGKGIK